MNYFANALMMASRPVRSSPEFLRIRALPRRTAAEADVPSNVPFEAEWRLAGCGDTKCPYNGPLFPVQRAMLWEADRVDGLFANAGVGAGKTLTSLLLPTVLEAERPVLMVPAALRAQTQCSYEHLSQHWTLVKPTILTYSDLSNPRKCGILDTVYDGQGPDLIVADECHTLASYTSARGKRFRKFFKSHPDTRFCGLSGTMTKRSLRDYAYLAFLALRNGSPCPKDYKTLEHWGFALDDLRTPLENCDPGVLMEFCAEGEDVRQGYGRRVAETPGVVVTKAQSCDASIVFRELPVKPPAAVKLALMDLRHQWMLPDGTELVSALDYHRAVQQLAQGFWLRWTNKAPLAWLDARKAWCAEMHAYLNRGRTGIDSPFLYEEAVTNGTVISTSYADWAAIEGTFKPVTETVWVDDFLAKAAARWVKEGRPGICWSRNPTFGRRIAELAGVGYFGDGPKDQAAIVEFAEGPEAGRTSFVASLQSHGTGRNFQAWDRMLFPYPEGSSETFEQAIGRIHRSGQEADEVEVFVALPTIEAKQQMSRAIDNARYVEPTFQQRPRLLSATYTFPVAYAVPTLDVI